MPKKPKIYNWSEYQIQKLQRYRQSAEIKKKGIHGLFADATVSV